MIVGDDRPNSEILVDLHVYVVPHHLWQEPLHSAGNEIVTKTVSAGFLRIHPETHVITLRDEIPKQFAGHEFELVPQEYVFLKSVGRCLTRVKVRQEREIKVKHFLPPHAYCPEIFIMEPTAAMRQLMASEEESSRQSYHNDSYRQGNKSTGGYNAKSSSRQTDHGSSRSHGGGSHFDSGFSTYSGQNESAMQSPKRAHKAHFNESGSEDEDKRGMGSQRDRHSLSPNKSERGSKRSTFDASNSPSKSGNINGTDRSHYDRSRSPHELPSTSIHLNDENQEYGSSGAHGTRGYGEGHASRGHVEGSRSGRNSTGSKSGLKRTTSENSDDEFADELGGRESTPLPLSEQQQNLLDKLEKIRLERRKLETKREDMVKKAKYLQSKTTSKRNQARDVWKKRYFEEKKKTPPLEERSCKLRNDLEHLHRRIVSQMEGTSYRVSKMEKPIGKPAVTEQDSMRINATKLNHEIEELQRRVDDAKMKLTGEVKLRTQAENELRAMRAELTQRKINVTLSRSQKLDTIQMEQDLTHRSFRAVTPESS